MSEARTCTVQELKERLDRGDCRVMDVREYPEYVEAHLPESRLTPLGELKRRPELGGEGEVYVLCRSGRRAAEAAALLADRSGVEPVIVGGGLEAWRQAGYPVRSEKGPISLERQVRIAAGALMLIGLLVPGVLFLSYLVAAGLIFAGVTNTCGMGLLLAKLPWNRRKEPPACPAAG